MKQKLKIQCFPENHTTRWRSWEMGIICRVEQPECISVGLSFSDSQKLHVVFFLSFHWLSFPISNCFPTQCNNRQLCQPQWIENLTKDAALSVSVKAFLENISWMGKEILNDGSQVVYLRTQLKSGRIKSA